MNFLLYKSPKRDQGVKNLKENRLFRVSLRFLNKLQIKERATLPLGIEKDYRMAFKNLVIDQRRRDFRPPLNLSKEAEIL